MKIGIVVYSQTGNTYSVAERLKKLLKDVTIERIEVEGEINPAMKEVKFKYLPKLDKYDTIIFASPVQAFSLTKVMKDYLEQINSLKDKKIACFVTEGFPYSWMGGNHAIKQMINICEKKNGQIIGSGVINWTKKRKDITTDKLLSYFTELLKSDNI